MIDDQAMRIGVAFARQAAITPHSQLCVASKEVLNVKGAGISIRSGSEAMPICATDEQVKSLEDLQFILGNGPINEAFVTGAAVCEADLELAGGSRWPEFSGPACVLGLRAVFAFPLQHKTESPFGVLTFYQNTKGDLTSNQQSDGEAVADVIAETLLSFQSTSKDGGLARELLGAAEHRAEVHQASGILAVRLSISVDEAMLRIRAYAFAHDRPIGDIASDVVHGRLLFEDDSKKEGD